MKQKTLVIGLTGGIASGKSLVLKEFRKLGSQTLDSDVIAKDVVEPNQSAYKKIVKIFGPNILQKNGNLDRKKLGSLVFFDPKKRKLLESIIHPEVIRNLRQEIKSSQSQLLVIDIPLLFEAKLQNLVDKIIVVWAPLNQQMARLQKRNKLSSGEIRNRIRSQWSLKKKCAWADFVIDNSKNSSHTRSQVKNLYTFLTKNG